MWSIRRIWRKPRNGKPDNNYLKINLFNSYQETPSCVTTKSCGGSGAFALAVITSKFSVAGPPPTPLYARTRNTY